VGASAGPFNNGVGAVGVIHEVERFAQFDKLVDEEFGTLKMNVVVARSMNQE
jgi:hypothetical protein